MRERLSDAMGSTRMRVRRSIVFDVAGRGFGEVVGSLAIGGAAIF